MEGCPDCERNYLLQRVNKNAYDVYGKDKVNSFHIDTLRLIVKRNACSGKTTATAIGYVAQAMLNPNQGVFLQHDSGKDRLHVHKEMQKITQEVIDKLGLRYLEIDAVKNMLTYNI